MSDPNRIELGSAEMPDVLRTLAGVLPQFSGDDLEGQLQTFDTFLDLLAPSVRPQIAELLREAAARATAEPVRARIDAAADAVARGSRAAAPYDHAAAMAAYTNTVPESPPPPAPAAPPVGETRSHPKILAQLDLIEAELKRIGRWSDPPPPDYVAKVERGEAGGYLDAPTFELWLQVVLLPRARRAAREDALPDTSMVGEMARRQYDYMSVDADAEVLMRLLQHFDELVVQAG